MLKKEGTIFSRLAKLFEKDKTYTINSSGPITVTMPPTNNHGYSYSSVLTAAAAAPPAAYNITVPTAAAQIPSTINSGWITSAAGMGGGVVGGAMNVGAGQAGAFTMSFPPPSNNIITLSNAGKEIVRLDKDGTVTWANGIDIDEAADAFAKAIGVGAELSAGISRSVKRKMRDSVFEDLIEIAKEKGSLTADDLTYLLQASKIVEKLKGGRD